jgi:hypothetical protein
MCIKIGESQKLELMSLSATRANGNTPINRNRCAGVCIEMFALAGMESVPVSYSRQA